MPFYIHFFALMSTLWLGAVLPSTYDASGQYVFAPFNNLLLFSDLAIILLLDLRTPIVTAALGHVVGNIWAHVALHAIVSLQNIDDWSAVSLWLQVSLFFTMIAIARKEVLLIWRCLIAFCLALRADDELSAPEGPLVLVEPKGSSTSGDAADASPQTAEPAADPLDDASIAPEDLLALVESKDSSANGDQAEALSPTEEQTMDFLGDFLTGPESRLALVESQDSSAADMVAEALPSTAGRMVAPLSDNDASADGKSAETSAQPAILPRGVSNRRTMTRRAVRSEAKSQLDLGSLAQLIPGSFIRTREELEQDEGLLSVGKMTRFARWHSRLNAHQTASQVFVWPASLLAVVDDDELTLEKAVPMPMDHEEPDLLQRTADLPVFDALAERLNDWRGLDTPTQTPCGARQTRKSLPLDAYSSHVSPPSIDEYSTGKDSEVVSEAVSPSEDSDSASESRKSGELAVLPCEEIFSSDAAEEVADPSETANLSSHEDSSPRFEVPMAIEETAVAPVEPVRDVGQGSGEGDLVLVAVPLYQPHVTDGTEFPASPVIAAEAGPGDAGAVILESPVESDQGASEQPGTEEDVPATAFAAKDAGHSASIPSISITAPDDEPETESGTDYQSTSPLHMPAIPTAAEAESSNTGRSPGNIIAHEHDAGRDTGAGQPSNGPERVKSPASDYEDSGMQDVTPAAAVTGTNEMPNRPREPEHASDAMECEHSTEYHAPVVEADTVQPKHVDQLKAGFDTNMADPGEADIQKPENEDMEGLEWEDVPGLSQGSGNACVDLQAMQLSDSISPAANRTDSLMAQNTSQQADDMEGFEWQDTDDFAPTNVITGGGTQPLNYSNSTPPAANWSTGFMAPNTSRQANDLEGFEWQGATSSAHTYGISHISTQPMEISKSMTPAGNWDTSSVATSTSRTADVDMAGLDLKDAASSAAHNDISYDDTQPMDESESSLPATSWDSVAGAPSFSQQADMSMADVPPKNEAQKQVHSVSQPAAPQDSHIFGKDQNNGDLVLVNPEDVARTNAQRKTLPGITAPSSMMGSTFGSTPTQPSRSTWRPQPLPEASSRTTKRSHEDDVDTETPPGIQATPSIAGSASESSSAHPSESSRRIVVPKASSGATKRLQDVNAQSSAFSGITTASTFTGTISGQSSTWASSPALGTSSFKANASALQQQPVPEASSTPAKRSLKSDAGQTRAEDVSETTPRSLKELVATRERDQSACWSCGGKADAWNPLNLFQLCQDCAFAMPLDDTQKEAISNNFPCESCHKSLLADSDYNMGIDWLYRLCGRPACVAKRQKQQPKKADTSAKAAPAKQSDGEQTASHERYGQKKHKASPSADLMVEDEKPLYPPLFDPDKNVEEKLTIIASEVDSLRDALKEWRARVVDNQPIKDDVEEYRTKLNQVLICLRDDYCKPGEADKYVVFDLYDFGQACTARLDEIEKLLHKLELMSEDEVEQASIQALKRLVSNARNPKPGNAGIVQKLRALLFDWQTHNQRYSDALRGRRVMRYNFESTMSKGYKKEVLREKK
ncbi:hypothetical protein KC331_g1578 [Hortaea werneckii]|nr:hypothetical protein KC331_g1578 [Hortaea werneckii]KAI7721076.1 hypothetical protein KC353_g1659 [Hortaea werneckii]